MNKTDEFIREAHADLAPLSAEDGKATSRTAAAVSEIEMRQADELAAALRMTTSKLIRVSLRRMLRDARKAGVMVPEKA